MFAADIDGDGDVDLASASSNDNKIAWYKTHFTHQEIKAKDGKEYFRMVALPNRSHVVSDMAISMKNAKVVLRTTTAHYRQYRSTLQC